MTPLQEASHLRAIASFQMAQDGWRKRLKKQHNPKKRVVIKHHIGRLQLEIDVAVANLEWQRGVAALKDHVIYTGSTVREHERDRSEWQLSL